MRQVMISPVVSRTLKPLLAALCLATAVSSGLAADNKTQTKKPSLLQDDFPFQGACISAIAPANNTAMKGLAIRVGNDANMLFDTDLLRMSAGWTGGYISTRGVAFDGGHGQHPKIEGTQKFGSHNQPGWANASGEFKDPRSEPFGPLPADWCRWDGIYVAGLDTVLSYTVHGTKIYEQPSSTVADGQIGFVRTFQIEKAAAALATVLCEAEGAKAQISGATATLTSETNVTKVALVGAPKGAKLELSPDNQVLLKIAKGTGKSLFKVVIWKGETEAQDKFASLLTGKPHLIDFKKGGQPHWAEPVVTQGVLATSKTPDGAYETDSITAPTDNPWKRRVRFSGMDFFSDGTRAALCTHDGDIWVVSGIDQGLEKVTWKRFASGMYETLGLVIVDDVIYTSGRDQVTRYYDLNKDGEADYYEDFNNQIKSTEGFHEFVFDLQRDDAGNFYFAKANPVNSGGAGFGRGGANGTVCEHAGCVFKLDKKGKNLEIIARGVRAPNGIGVSPEGQVTTSDNEGTWVPSTPINWITKNGQFLGVLNKLTPKALAETWTPPICWLSHSDYDNSGGGQVWVTSDKWGPFKGELLHESYGKSSLFLVMRDQVGDKLQGGVVKFPLKFTSSVMRAKFNKKDGQLYIAGLSEWQSNAGKVTGFDRVRYTGKPVYGVKSLKVVHEGVQLTFTQPLATDSAADIQNFSGKRWNYERAEHYGSPELSVADPKKKGRDVIEIKGTKLSNDGKTLTVEIADLKPVMQQSLKFNLKAADGTPIAQEIQHTIHAIP
ncbi:MAG: Large, multifunctional secreted protein [Verrucomicrobiales bacterium]|nr:Large, multifunctional secreted protein [Verrucomicrobiales bacterium]